MYNNLIIDNKIEPNIGKQKLLSFTIVYMLSFLCLLNCVNAITGTVLGIQTNLDTAILYILMFVLVFASLLRTVFSDNLKTDVVLLFFFWVVAFFMTYILFPDNLEYINNSLEDYAENSYYILFIYSVPAYIFIRYLDTFEYFEKYLKLFSYIVVTISVIVYFFAADSSANQYMTLSYNMLLQLFYLCLNIPKKHKIWHYIVTGMGLFVLIFGGARGPLVGLMVGIVINILFKQDDKNKRSFYIFFLVLFAVVFLFLYRSILEFIYNLLVSWDIESRTLEKLLFEEGDLSSGRFDIYKSIIDEISVFGKGLFSDRVILGNRYVHNLFLEWLSNFGIVGGGCLSIGFITLFIKTLKKNRHSNWIFFLLLIPNGLVGLLFSSSYLLQNPWFYAMLGFMINISED